MRISRSRTLRGLVSLLSVALPLSSYAQSATPEPEVFPSKAVRIVVPYPPGGATDVLARAIGAKLAEKWQQPVLIDNRGGASGAIGASYVAKAPADGYTLLIADSAPFVVLPALQSKLPFALSDLAPITTVVRQTPALAVNAALPVNSVKELLAYLKQHPNTPYASVGTGSWSHVTMADLGLRTGTQMLHVPYKGTGPALTDLIGGQVALHMGTLGTLRAHQAAGKVKVLAVATAKRVPFAPELPTLDEAGIPGFSIDVWFGLVAPAGTPAAVIEKIQRDVDEVTHTKAFSDGVLADQAMAPGDGGSAAFAALLKRDTARWARMVKDSNITP